MSNTMHCHKPSGKIPRHSPNGEFHNQIDFMLVSIIFALGVNTTKTRTFPGANIGSDHNMVLITLKIEDV